MMMTTTRDNGVNLDAMFPSELDAFEANAANHSGLRTYARTKARAMRMREKGHIVSASKLEDTCETLYRALPKTLRW